MAVVKPSRTPVPELDGVGDEVPDAPMRRARDDDALESRGHLDDQPLELLARGDGLALRRRPRADLAVTWT